MPQLFVATGATKWNEPKDFPWTMGWQPSYQSEARIYAKFLMKEKPDAKIAIMYQNDDFGKDYLKGLKDGLGAKASMIIAEESYETSEPTIDNHIVKLKATGADVFINITTPKFAAQAIKKIAEIDWKPMHIVSNVSASVGSVIKPAGFENAQGILSAAYAKDGADAQWDNDPGMKKFYAFLDKYYPEANKLDGSVVYGYGVAQTMVKVLEMCGDDLTRANVMKQAASLKDFAPGHPAARRQDQHLGHRLRPDRTASDAAVQGREMGAVRRHHQRRTSAINIPPHGQSARDIRLNIAPCDTVAGGFLLPGAAERYSMPPTAAKCCSPRTNDTFIVIPGRTTCLLSTCDWGPFRLPSHCLPPPAAARLLKKNTTSAPPTPKSRSATSCPTADLLPPTA